jgi:hypothetical protein
MAIGDDAAALGMDIMDGSEDKREGFIEINRTRDYIAQHAVIADQETYVHNDVGGNRIVIQRVPATLTLEAWIDNTRLGTINITP